MAPETASVLVAGIAAFAAVANTRMTVRQNRKIDETHKQVTVNHHSSDIPTVLDRIDDVQVAVMKLNASHNELRIDLNDHVTDSNRMHARLLARGTKEKKTPR